MKKVVTKIGKPFQSALKPYEREVFELKADNLSVRAIAAEMKRRHGLDISHNSVASFLRTHRPKRKSFLDGLSETRKGEVLKALKAIWTHDSTAIEGNTLSLGDTMILLEYGLTVKGKPLKDQQDIVAHARAVDRIRELVDRRQISEQDLLDLHRLTVVEEVRDIYKPVGAWKREDNGTYGSVNGRGVYMAYAPAADVPALMKRWLEDFNRLFAESADLERALSAYVRAHTSFVRIHPFYDGNGRLARLLANLPVLFAGFPPVVVPAEARTEYISALWDYQQSVGPISARSPELLPQPERLEIFSKLVAGWWRSTIEQLDIALPPLSAAKVLNGVP